MATFWKYSKLFGTMPWQFRGKSHTEALCAAFETEIEELQDMFEELLSCRTLEKSEQKQLDGIGDIVVLNRAEAGLLASKKKGKLSFPVIDDLRYKKFLRYKILKNTSVCTYEDVVTAVKMVYEQEPIRVYENRHGPATLAVCFPEPEGAEDVLEDVPPIKAAGVGIRLYGETKHEINTELMIGSGTIKGADINIKPCPVDAVFHENLYVGTKAISTTLADIKPKEVNLIFKESNYIGGRVYELSHITIIPKPPAQIKLSPVRAGAGIVKEVSLRIGHIK